MTALTWLAMASALALVPLPSVAWRRALGLSRRGRLARVPVNRPLRPQTWRSLRSRQSWRSWPPSAVGLVGCGASAGAGYIAGGPALAVAAAVVAATAALLIASALARRHESRRRQGLLAAVRLVVAELSAGSRPDAALGAAAAAADHAAADHGAAADHAAAFAVAAATAGAGGDAADALLTATSGDLAPFGHAWRVAQSSGAPLADVLGRVAADLADQEQQQRSVGVALAGPRSSAALLAGLPVVGIALGAAMGARPLAFLLGTPQGRLVCCAGAVLDAAGVLWTQWLIQRAQRP
jgi:tight adherence protein B